MLRRTDDSFDKLTIRGRWFLVGALALLFTGLKLAGVIDWPWVWVVSPLWIGAAIVILILLVSVIIFLIAGAPSR